MSAIVEPIAKNIKVAIPSDHAIECRRLSATQKPIACPVMRGKKERAVRVGLESVAQLFAKMSIIPVPRRIAPKMLKAMSAGLELFFFLFS